MRTPPSVTNDRPESTDALYDLSPAAMAARFGARALRLLREGRDVRMTVRLAASYAFMADPSLRDPESPSTLADHLWRLGTELNVEARERLQPTGTVQH
jgi:hypothetical protein